MIGQQHGYIYDAFGRMVEYRKNVSNSGTVLARYRYNGLNQRIMWQYDADADSYVDDDERYYFVHDARWRIVATLRSKGAGSATTLAEAFVYHNAGLAGRGGSSYIDSVIVRDAEKAFDWVGEGDNVLDERTFYLQNWRHDVVAIVDSDGLPIEEIRYTAYGTPTLKPIADVDGDGDVDTTDSSVWSTLTGGGTATTAVWANSDLNRDGLYPDSADDTLFYSRYADQSGLAAGWKKLSVTASRKGYAGYEWDDCCTTWHVRHRMLDSESGKWTRMDPLGYVDTFNLFELVFSAPIGLMDPFGMAAVSHKSGNPVPRQLIPGMICESMIASICSRGNTPSTDPCWIACARAIRGRCAAGVPTEDEASTLGITAKQRCYQDRIPKSPGTAELLYNCLWDTCGDSCPDCFKEALEMALGTSFRMIKKGRWLLQDFPACIFCTDSLRRGEPDWISCGQCGVRYSRHRDRRWDNRAPDPRTPGHHEMMKPEDMIQWSIEIQLNILDGLFSFASCYNCYKCIDQEC